MASRRVRVVVLCEGVADYRFAYRCLRECGWREDQITANISRSGRGSAFDHVLDSYSAEVHANRKGGGQRDLLVLIDADTQRDGGRERQLAERLRIAGEPVRKKGERISLWVPRRQMETWVHFLKHGKADEQSDYKRLHAVRDEDRQPAAQKFARMLAKRQPLPSGAVRSMRKAVEEFERIRTAPGGQGPARPGRKAR
jgi:hypothetical protein